MPKGSSYLEGIRKSDPDKEAKRAEGRMEKLVEAAGDLVELREHFYAPLLKKIENEKKITPGRLAAVFDKVLEKEEAKGTLESVRYVQRRASDILRALADGDEDFAAEAIQAWKERQE